MRGVLRGVGFSLLDPPDTTAHRTWWIEGDAAIAQGIRHLLLTEPGERIGRPSYGVGLRQFLYEPNNVATRTLLRETVLTALRLQEPRIQVQRIEVVASPEDDAVLLLDIHYLTRSGLGRLVQAVPLDDRS